MKYLLSHPHHLHLRQQRRLGAPHRPSARPRLPGQKVELDQHRDQPGAGAAVQHVDHFGNSIDIYRIDKPHTRFDIEVRAAIDVRFPDPPPRQSTPPWEEIRAALSGDGFPRSVEASEFVLQIAAGARSSRR